MFELQSIRSLLYSPKTSPRDTGIQYANINVVSWGLVGARVSTKNVTRDANKGVHAFAGLWSSKVQFAKHAVRQNGKALVQ